MSPQVFKIAIVEDDTYYRKLLERGIHRLCDGVYKSSMDFEIVTYGNPRELIAEMDETFSVIIMDYYLEAGYDQSMYTARELARAAALRAPETSILVVSNDAPANIQQKLNGIRVQDVIYKDKWMLSRVWGSILVTLNRVA